MKNKSNNHRESWLEQAYPEVHYLLVALEGDAAGLTWLDHNSKGVAELTRAMTGDRKALSALESEEPADLDDLFALVCGVQAEIGQQDVEFSLVEVEPGGPQVPRDFSPLGYPEGQLLHTFHGAGQYVMLVVPAIFRVPAIVLASVARELGRIAIHVADRAAPERALLRAASEDDPRQREADAELAAIALGLGVWVANGSYVFENACCGGGCGIDLRSVRAGLSMPEACFALAVDGQRKGVSRRTLARHLDATQRAALKRSWGYVRKQPALVQAPSVAALSG
jgi:hypothetical protein